MNSVIPQIAHDAKPANPRRVSMRSSLPVSGSSAPSGLTQIVRLSRMHWQGEAGARDHPAPAWESGCSSGAPPPHACARGPSSARRIALPKSANDQRRVLALAFAHAARLHPVVGAVEQRHVVIVDMLVAHERPQQFLRLQGALGVGRDVVGVFVKVGVDQVDGLVLGVVIGLALLRRQIGRDDLAATIEGAAMIWAPSLRPRLMNGSITAIARAVPSLSAA